MHNTNLDIAQSKPRRPRRYDPDRRDKIIQATLISIAENGVSETSLRGVANIAEVPLGSMTYHFKNREELLFDAFSFFAKNMLNDFENQLKHASDAEQAAQAIVNYICEERWFSKENLLISYELYAFSARTEYSKSIICNWLEGVRECLLAFFDRNTANALDALIEGYSIHRSIDQTPPSKREIEVIVKKLTQ